MTCRLYRQRGASEYNNCWLNFLVYSTYNSSPIFIRKILTAMWDKVSFISFVFLPLLSILVHLLPAGFVEIVFFWLPYFTLAVVGVFFFWIATPSSIISQFYWLGLSSLHSFCHSITICEGYRPFRHLHLMIRSQREGMGSAFTVCMLIVLGPLFLSLLITSWLKLMGSTPAEFWSCAWWIDVTSWSGIFHR